MLFTENSLLVLGLLPTKDYNYVASADRVNILSKLGFQIVRIELKYRGLWER